MNINTCNSIPNKGKSTYFSYNMIYENKVNADVYICMRSIKTNRGFPLGKDEGAKWKRS